MRHEKKYKLEHYSLAILEQAIRSHPAGFRKIFPDRKVNNIYFDTPALSTYADNVIGIAERKKFRVRWYGEQGNEVKRPRFEVKIKQNYLGTKEIFDVDDFELNNIPELTTRINKLLNSKNVLSPILMNSYWRSYFGTSDGKFRITIDRTLAYSSMLVYAGRSIPRPTYDKGYILELKYDKEFDGSTDRITQFLPFRQTKSSKYVTGVLLTS